MSETEQTVSEAEAPGPVAGARLAVARRAHEITAREIAKELHLDEPTVLALEQNNFDQLGAPVFAKGHLRKYAELVGVPIEDILADYYQLNRSTGAPPVVGRPRIAEPRRSAKPWIVAAIVVIAAGAATWWWAAREPAQVATPAATQAPAADGTAEPAPAADAAMDAEAPATQVIVSYELESTASADDAAAEVVDAAVPVTSDAVSAEPVASAPAIEAAAGNEIPAPAASGPLVGLKLTFNGDCWTEITDADGRRLFYDLGTAGRVASLEGVEPFDVVLGDASRVQIEVDGRAYTISQPVREGRLTRLSISSR